MAKVTHKRECAHLLQDAFPENVMYYKGKPNFPHEACTMIRYLKLELDDAVPTAGTDGVRLVLNLNWWLGLTKSQRKAVLYHEVKHALFAHGLRRKDREPVTWNVACDMVINTEDARLGHDLPEGGGCQLPPELDTPILPSPETVYDWLVSNRVDTVKLLGDQGLDVLAPTEQGKKRAVGNLGRAWACSMVNQRSGQLAGHGEEVSEHYAPNTKGSDANWRAMLGHMMLSKVRSGADWGQPSNRLLTSGIYTPRTQTSGIRHIMAGVDVSSSMPPELVGRIVADLDALRRSLLIETMEIVTFNSRVNAVRKVSLHQPLNWHPFVGGGTSFQGISDLAVQKNPDFLLMLTDGEAPDPDPYFPRTVWLIYDSVKVLYPGRVFHVA